MMRNIQDTWKACTRCLPLRFAAGFFLVLAALVPSTKGALTASYPRCEYLTSPIGIDEVSPRLSWIVTAPDRGESQSAYEIIVASTPMLLAANEGDLWDSGEVTSSATAQIVYAAPRSPPAKPVTGKCGPGTRLASSPPGVPRRRGRWGYFSLLIGAPNGSTA